MKTFLSYVIILISAMCLFFALHFKFFEVEKAFLVKSYIINTILSAIAIYSLNYGIKKKSNLTNIYLCTVALKLIIYFLIFHPELKADGFISKEKFLVFFVPYLLGLISEILILTKSFDT